MRKTLEKTVNAFLNGKHLRVNNSLATTTNGERHYYLFGNRIARINTDGELIINNCGWASPTTVERLNAILNLFGSHDHVQIKKGVMYFRNAPMEMNEDITIIKHS